MKEIELRIRYDGLEAERHRLNMRQLAHSLVGLDRILSQGLASLVEGRVITGRERGPIVVSVAPPEIGCVTLQTFINAAEGVAPLLMSIMNEHGSAIAWNLLSSVLKRFGGKKAEAEAHMSELLDFTREMFADRQHEREHVERIIESLQPSARAIVTPVGRSCETLQIADLRSGSRTEVDVAMADAVRASEPVEVGDLAEMRVRVDGLIFHSRTLKLEIPGEPGRFVTADVRDPAFDAAPNVYTESLQRELIVSAKPTYRDGKLVKLYVMDARTA